MRANALHKQNVMCEMLCRRHACPAQFLSAPCTNNVSRCASDTPCTMSMQYVRAATACTQHLNVVDQCSHHKLGTVTNANSLILAMFFFIFMPMVEDAPPHARTFVFLQSDMTMSQFAALVLQIYRDNGWLIGITDRVSYWHGYAADLDALGTPVGFSCFNCQAYK